MMWIHKLQRKIPPTTKKMNNGFVQLRSLLMVRMNVNEISMGEQNIENGCVPLSFLLTVSNGINALMLLALSSAA